MGLVATAVDAWSSACVGVREISGERERESRDKREEGRNQNTKCSPVMEMDVACLSRRIMYQLCNLQRSQCRRRFAKDHRLGGSHK